MRLYYVTTKDDAESILANGFSNDSGVKRLGVVTNDGIWLMSFPYVFDLDEYVCLAVDIDLPGDAIEEWHWHDQGTAWDWFLAPAEKLNAHAKVVQLTKEEAGLVILKHHYQIELPPSPFSA